MRSPFLTALLAAAVLGAGCRTTSIREMASSPTPRVRVGTHKKTWEIRGGGELLGLVVLFEDRGRERDSLYIVRNAYHQDLGLIDGLGRAYRYLPHREEPVWVGSGTITAGARSILGASAECELVELLEPADAPLLGAPLEFSPQRGEADPEQPAQPSGSTAPDGGLPQSR